MKHLKLKLSFLTISIILTLLANFIFKTNLINLIIYILAFIFASYFKTKTGLLDTIEDKSLNVEMLMVLAAIGSFILGDYNEGIILLLIFALSDILETYTKGKSQKTLQNLIKLSPETAILVKDNQELEVQVDDLKIGDIIRVNRGQSLSADGIIIDGVTTIDEQMITGEYVPKEKRENDHVFAGTMNLSYSILVKVTKNAHDFIANNVVRFVKEASESKSKKETSVKKFEKLYVNIVILLAILTFFIPYTFQIWDLNTSFYRSIIVLVVGSPCAVVASITPAVLSSLAKHARLGVLIKGGEVLDRLERIDTIFLDKTGTLTKGQLTVSNYETTLNLDFFKRLVYTMELNSNHPIGKALVRYFQDQESLNIKVEEEIGIGMKAYVDEDFYTLGRMNDLNERPLYYQEDKGYTYIYLLKNKTEVGYIALYDELRDEATILIEHLNKLNLDYRMLTGDNEESARVIARKANIDHVHANLMPEDKLKMIHDYQKLSHHVLMTGDGINDAAALKHADVGVAMQSGMDISLDAADVVLIKNDLSMIAHMIQNAKNYKKIYVQNLIFSVFVIILLLISNIFGLIILPFAVLFHEGSTILVILNSLRLLK